MFNVSLSTGQIPEQMKIAKEFHFKKKEII